jgi:hypothetical protein
MKNYILVVATLFCTSLFSSEIKVEQIFKTNEVLIPLISGGEKFLFIGERWSGKAVIQNTAGAKKVIETGTGRMLNSAVYHTGGNFFFCSNGGEWWNYLNANNWSESKTIKLDSSSENQCAGIDGTKLGSKIEMIGGIAGNRTIAELKFNLFGSPSFKKYGLISGPFDLRLVDQLIFSYNSGLNAFSQPIVLQKNTGKIIIGDALGEETEDIKRIYNRNMAYDEANKKIFYFLSNEQKIIALPSTNPVWKNREEIPTSLLYPIDAQSFGKCLVVLGRDANRFAEFEVFQKINGSLKSISKISVTEPFTFGGFREVILDNGDLYFSHFNGASKITNFLSQLRCK